MKIENNGPDASIKRCPAFLLYLLLLAAMVLGFLNLHRIRIANDHFGSLEKFISDERELPEVDGAEADELVWGLRVIPDTLSPVHTGSDAYTRMVMVGNVFEPLLFIDMDTGGLNPALAEGFSVSDDGHIVEFKLRKGVCFSDGHEFDAEDVIFTYEAVRAAGFSTEAMNTVTGVVALDGLRVAFKLSRPVSNPARGLSFQQTGIIPSHVSGDALIGTGPYVVDNQVSGELVKLYRNRSYWGQAAGIERVSYRYVSNATATIIALKSGVINVMSPEPEQFSILCEDNDFLSRFRAVEYYTPSGPFYGIGWNMRQPLFEDRDFRRAMTMLVNREEIVESMMNGIGRVVATPFAEVESIEPLVYSPTDAMELLTELGWEDKDGDGIRDKDGKSLSFELLYPAGSELYEQIVRVLVDSMGRAGVGIEAIPSEWSVFRRRVERGGFDAMMMAWAAEQRNEPGELWHSKKADGGLNYVGYCSAEVDDLIEDYLVESDASEQHVLLCSIAELIHRDQPYTFLFERPSLRFLDRRFKNVIIHSLGMDYREWYVPKGGESD